MQERELEDEDILETGTDEASESYHQKIIENIQEILFHREDSFCSGYNSKARF